MSRAIAVSPPHDAPTQGATRRHLRGSSLLLSGRFLSLGLNCLVHILIVRYLARSDFGAYAFAMVSVAMGASIACFGMDKAFGRFVPIFEEQRDYGRLAGTMLLVLGTICLIGAAEVAIVLFAWHYGAGALGLDVRAVGLLALLSLLAPLQALDNVLLKGFAIFASARSVFWRKHVLGPALRLAAAASLLLTQNVYVLATAMLAAGLVGTLYCVVLLAVILLRKGLLVHFRPGRWRLPAREVFGFSTPLLAGEVVFIFRTWLVVFLVEVFHGVLAVAGYRAVLPIARLNTVVFESFKLLYLPTAARAFARDEHGAISHLYWSNAIWVALLTFPLFAIGFAFARPATVFLFGHRYADAAVILSLLSLAYYAHSVFSFNALTLRIFGNVRILLAVDLLVVVFILAGNWLVIPRFGAVGGAAVVAATLLLQNVAHQVALIRTGAVAPCCRRDAGILVAIAVASLASWTAGQWLRPDLPEAVVLTGLATLALWWWCADALDILETFPELRRIAPVRLVLENLRR